MSTADAFGHYVCCVIAVFYKIDDDEYQECSLLSSGFAHCLCRH